MIMLNEIVATLICLVLMITFMAYFVIYHQRMMLAQHQKATQEKSSAITRTLDRFFEENEKEGKRAKLAQVEQLRKEIEAKIAVQTEMRKAKAAEQIEQHGNEKEVIEEAGKVYLSFFDSMKPAMPQTEAEKAKDMDDLMDAVKALEKWIKINISQILLKLEEIWVKVWFMILFPIKSIKLSNRIIIVFSRSYKQKS